MKKKSKQILLSAFLVGSPQGFQEANMETTVGEAVSKTAMAKSVEKFTDKIIEKDLGIKKDHAGYVAAASLSVIRGEISTYSLQNSFFYIGNTKVRLDGRYKLVDHDTNLTFSVSKEF